MMRRLSFTLVLFLALTRSVSAQTTYTVGYWPQTSGTSPAAIPIGATSITLAAAPAGLFSDAVVTVDRTGANPELLTIASSYSAGNLTLLLTTPTAFAHAAGTSVDWVAAPSNPVSTFPIPPANLACNQVAPAVQPVVVLNPTALAFDDQVNAGKFCVATIPTFYSAIPVGKYWAAIRAEDASVSAVTAWGLPRPFGRLAALVTPTGLRILR